ncbi:11-beta-hydroxysteroid dehydrogenase 1A-like [Cornus florida]|uniref:11-beta-hydroxysteroid dehydrogenase 1A-like n=1 Tax=Cornus florida TaxID=4283 RepID=UPI00289FD226|nr:11-beta-hydroxysteroid dehydrogenase 1A-like [Cornus florida]
MDMNHLIHNCLNEVVMAVVFVSLCLILSPFFIFKFMHMISRCFCSTENMKGKVVLITGASSGIGEQLAYEYAKKEASLVIVARREKRLLEVAEKARGLGSPHVLSVCADVSDVNDCKRFVDETINHFGQLDHLVNNAGIGCTCTFEDVTDITKFAPVMDINFWGSIYATHFAIPHLKKTKGKIVVNSSSAALLHPPRMNLYSASKAALISFYETLRVELVPEITMTIITLGFIESEITQGKVLSKDGFIEVNCKLRDDAVQAMPVMSCRACAKAIVHGVCRGERYVTEPKWFRVLFMLRSLSPELVEWYYRTFYFTKPTISNQMVSDNLRSTSHGVTQTKAD